MQSINTCANWNSYKQQLVSNSESFFRPLFRLVTQSRGPKRRLQRRSYASLTSDLERSEVFFLLGVFLCACILWDAVYWKTNLSLKKSEIYSPVFPTFGAQAITMITAAHNRRLHVHARFNSFVYLFASERKTTRKVMIKFKVSFRRT